MAMMLAAMKSDLTRFITLALSDAFSGACASPESVRGTRVPGCLPAAWAARRAARRRERLPTRQCARPDWLAITGARNRARAADRNLGRLPARAGARAAVQAAGPRFPAP